MELRHLRYFVAVAEELNFRKAAERVRVSPPALSRQIKDLESETGVQLLVRNTGGVRLNGAGAVFLKEARLTLAQFQQTLVAARDIANGQRGHLTVAYVEPVFMGFMPWSMIAFRRRWPGVEVRLVEIPFSEQIAAVESGAIDIGFTPVGNPPLPRSLQRVEIVQSPLCVVVGKRHRLASCPRVTLADLTHAPLLCLRLKKELPSLHGEIMHRLFSASGMKVEPIRQIEGTEAFRAQIISGFGVSLIPRIGGLMRCRGISFKSLKETGPELYVGLHAVTRAGPASRVAANFVEVMKEAARRKHASDLSN